MPIHFIYGRREALTGKAEAYKKAVRSYLESEGFSQTTDSFIEGSFPDMIFYNSSIAPGKKFLVETKADEVSLSSKVFAKELIQYFKMWDNLKLEKKFELMIFIQSLKKPLEWELLFSEEKSIEKIREWCDWYNKKVSDKKYLGEKDIEKFIEFFSYINIKVGNTIDLELAVIKKEEYSNLSMNKLADNLFKIIYKRKNPIAKKSNLIMNFLPVQVPKYYYEAKSFELNKKTIYDNLVGKTIPPFILKKDGTMMSFSEFDEGNPILKYVEGKVKQLKIEELQNNNPSLSSNLIYDHIRRILWKKGIYRVPETNIFYYPMENIKLNILEKKSYTGHYRWVVKKYIHQEDTDYAKKGEINFFFHRAVELYSQTFSGNSYMLLNPKRYYTLNGKNEIEGEIRAKIDSKFRNQLYDRSESKLDLLKFWKYRLFDSKEYIDTPEKWFDNFKFGGFIINKVNWSPIVIGKDQTRLWDFGGKNIENI
jgi:hypothetical protein